MLDRYSRPVMRTLWSPAARLQAWLQVELAVCEAWHAAGAIPADAMAEIRAKASFDIDQTFVDRVLEIEETTRHDVIAFLSALEERVGPAARFIHLGCTSSDIVDTANAVQLAQAGAVLDQGYQRILGVLKDMAFQYKGVLCMGRTHGVHAEPTSFGLKMAGFHAEFSRHYERFRQALEQIRVGKLSGAVGTYTHLSPAIEADACARLGLGVDPVSTQIVQRDRYAQFFTALALTAGGVERLCVELRHLQRTEVLEVEEGFGKGQKGSSAMPHKKNPISAENMSGLARVLRGNALAAMENMALWHERDISHSSVERIIMPDSTSLLDYILHRLCGVLERLVVRQDNMLRNMEASFGLHFSQKVLTALIESGLPRQEAYAMVQRHAMQSWETRTSFPALVRQDPAITARLSAATLDALFDPAACLTHEAAVFARVFGA
ncbi:MAG: adenylosuccinate lyase [Desulfovibrio sp.]|nr:adenylosuccinate lyase [Desulfovibrio sp.]MCA1987396.1 adenylosuccinate lyase [Desulfovibrio sp.]